MTWFPKISLSSGKVFECQLYINIFIGRCSTCSGASIVFYKFSFPGAEQSPKLPHDYTNLFSKRILRKILLRIPDHTPIEINNMYARITQQAKPQRKQDE